MRNIFKIKFFIHQNEYTRIFGRGFDFYDAFRLQFTEESLQEFKDYFLDLDHFKPDFQL